VTAGVEWLLPPIAVACSEAAKVSCGAQRPPANCWHGLLRAEGFTEIAYIEAPRQEFPQAFADGRVDFSVTFIVNHIQAIDRGAL
jgi:hypothetical protein